MQAHTHTRLTHVKLQKLACAHTVAHNFGMHTWDSKHTQHMRDARYELTLDLPHYTCGVTIGVGTNSGMDYWNGTLDWTTGLSYFPFLDRFMCLFLEEA